MIAVTQQGDSVEYGITSYVADAYTDIATIDKTSCGMGSTCLVIATGDVYMLNSSGTWVKL